jgi:hypothetical protein
MKKDTIVTLVMNNGAEIIARYIEEDFNTITVYKPRMVQASQQGVALVNGITMTGIEPKGNFQFPKSSVMFMIETVDELANGWRKQTSGLDLPPQTGIIS